MPGTPRRAGCEQPARGAVNVPSGGDATPAVAACPGERNTCDGDRIPVTSATDAGIVVELSVGLSPGWLGAWLAGGLAGRVGVGRVERSRAQLRYPQSSSSAIVVNVRGRRPLCWVVRFLVRSNGPVPMSAAADLSINSGREPRWRT